MLLVLCLFRAVVDDGGRWTLDSENYNYTGKVDPKNSQMIAGKRAPGTAER